MVILPHIKICRMSCNTVTNFYGYSVIVADFILLSILFHSNFYSSDQCDLLRKAFGHHLFSSSDKGKQEKHTVTICPQILLQITPPATIIHIFSDQKHLNCVMSLKINAIL